jgi:hypothetical protein
MALKRPKDETRVTSRTSVDTVLLDGPTGVRSILADNFLSFTPNGLGAVPTTFEAALKGRDVYTPEMFGGIPTTAIAPVGNVPDNTAAINRMIAALKAKGGGTAFFGPGVYKTTAGVLADYGNIHIEGAGPGSTWIIFEGGPGTVVQVGANAQQYNNSIRNISLGSSNSTDNKVALDLIDVSWCEVENVVIGHYPPGTGLFTGGGPIAGTNCVGSIGLRTNGRDTSRVRGLTAAADLPQVHNGNPNSTITLDSWDFVDCNYEGHFDGSSTNPLILVTDAAKVLTNNHFRGVQNWQGGTDGFRWIQTAAAFTSDGLTFSGIKAEQNPDSVAGVLAYTINIQSNQRITGVRVNNSLMGDRNGVKLHGVVNPLVETLTFVALKANLEAFNIDATCGTFDFHSCSFLTGLFPIAISAPGLNLVQKSEVPVGLGLSTIIPPTGRYSTGLTETFLSVAAQVFNNVGINAAGATAVLGMGNGINVQLLSTMSIAAGTNAALTFQGTDTYVGRSTVDTLANKGISLGTNALSGTTAQFNAALTDNDFATLAGAETLTNKVFNAANNTLSGITTAMFAANVIDTDVTLAANSNTRIPTQAAVVAYLAARVAALDVVEIKGGIDCSANPNYPAADAGAFYKVAVAGKIGGVSGANVESGDTLLCFVDGTAAGTQAAVGGNWVIVQSNLDGAVIGPAASVSGNLATFNGAGGKVIQDSGKALPAGTIVGTTDAQALTNKSYNGNTWTAGSGTLTFGAGKTLTFNNTLTFSGTDASTIAFGGGGTIGATGYSVTGQIAATATNDDAAAGKIGEYNSATLAGGAAISLTTATGANVVTLSLAAGDWDVWGTVYFLPAATTQINSVFAGVSTVSGAYNSTPGKYSSVYYGGSGAIGGSYASGVSQDTPMTRISLSGTTNVFLVINANFTVNTLTAFGAIEARRVR